jgi:hypothetical protein
MRMIRNCPGHLSAHLSGHYVEADAAPERIGVITLFAS